MKPKADSWELRGLGLEVRVEGDYMDDSQLVRTVRMLLRSYRTKYYALEERNIMRSVRGLRGGEEFRVESLGLEEGGQQGKPADAGGGKGGRWGGLRV